MPVSGKKGQKDAGGKNYFGSVFAETCSDLYSRTRREVDGLFEDGTMAFLPKASYGTTWR